MAIEIELSDCEERIRKAWKEFEQADEQLDCKGPELVAAMATLRQDIVNGRVGFLRSVYNSRGFFPLLDFIFGFDLARYLFPGDWNKPVPIDPPEFLEEVMALVRTAKIAEERQTPSPWIAIFEEVTGHPAHDGEPDYVETVELMDSVVARLSKVTESVTASVSKTRWNPSYPRSGARIRAEELDFPSYGPLPAGTRAEHIDYWRMLDDLYDFAKLAVELDAKFVTISG